ncbi:hypothetical protein EHI8A_023560 [Entamoeba histolytica HM-1:IMSS-B]|uniref:Ubiquitin-like domain-containing protein n=6 Tax=Entamoeba histolytica TaxID=5759 RepID=C4M8N9_ENTH1|nr:hypothetical protein EHI_053430 [Entamoeba histolytica HM-1:IMSS]EMD46227.1 Hypothetical protein EHI5A_033060 [Entamoeba histolytica KU27]EMH73135.1 hypothetical protein EHI8A_023560 [Entamoeba histolytica HM-1:IMSS-B]EMS13020.1 hypothetical protein KM1_041030 [Entamoeba histolytica HM-3:IMSS]ENY65950.1 hypothetical protein EHI7A_016200 [Entamoeba histolytica HM-1:IMSS-A]GAT97978.1 hypothetical protein CL6EHI_053430 [Entamoeba histolytica]|eukprot:XP_654236.1 hypothetical protein EHI_053430 [Entamoeba histolytica HM-1:IMSS]
MLGGYVSLSFVNTDLPRDENIPKKKITPPKSYTWGDVKQELESAYCIDKSYIHLFYEQKELDDKGTVSTFDKKEINLQIYTKLNDQEDTIVLYVISLLDPSIRYSIKCKKMDMIGKVKEDIMQSGVLVQPKQYIALYYMNEKNEPTELSDLDIIQSLQMQSFQPLYYLVTEYNEITAKLIGKGEITIKLKCEKKVIETKVPQQTTFIELKEKAAKLFEYDTNSFNIIFAGAEVNGNDTLFSKRIVDGTAFNIIIKA